MKKSSVILLCICLLILTFTFNVSADQITDETIITKLNILEDTKLEIRHNYELEDVYGNNRYKLIVFKNKGYLIYDQISNNIMEYSLNSVEFPYCEFIDSDFDLIYCGPLNYIVHKNNLYYEIHTMEIVDIDLTREYYDSLLVNEESSVQTTTSWTGISSSRFYNYKGSAWQNSGNNVNCCGPISTAIMIAYYQDYLNPILEFSTSVRDPSNPTSPGTLITKIKNSTVSPTATVPVTICNGVNVFLNNYNIASTYTCAYSSTSTWNNAVTKIGAGRPVAIGISGLAMYNGVNPNDYGWHWVTAYGYRTIDGSGYYRCIDNWGNYDVAIKTITTVGIVYLSR